MKNRYFILVIAIVFLLVIVGCSYKSEKEETDAIKFKNEYESLNGVKVPDSDKVYRSISIDKNNPVVYASASDILSMMDNNSSFVVYFGFSKCPWCRSVLPTLLEVASDLDFDNIYYVDVLDIRDKYVINDDGEVVLEKEGSEGYLGLLSKFENVLDDYTLTDKDGNEVKVGEKRIYAPNVVSVVNGVAKEMETGISDSQNDAYMTLTDEMKKETYNKFKCSLSCILESKTTCSSKTAC